MDTGPTPGQGDLPQQPEQAFRGGPLLFALFVGDEFFERCGLSGCGEEAVSDLLLNGRVRLALVPGRA